MNSQSPVSLYIAIPARFASTRLPGKPLQKIGARTMIERVAERALQLKKMLQSEYSSGVLASIEVIVATDQLGIQEVLKELPVRVVMTSQDLSSGTDRIHAALLSENLPQRQQDLVLNIQGDEPFFSLEDCAQLIHSMLKNPLAPMGTLAFERASTKLFLRPSVVKVVSDGKGVALSFSRAPVPWPRAILGASGEEWMTVATQQVTEEISFLQHLGVYSYRWEYLKAFATELAPSDLEMREGLEQLRAIQAGWKILLAQAKEEPFGIDTPEDLARAQEMIRDKLP
jgi:3-deoxy-manno-octulosonate cytidylyltransferase (CMP-KDO synthetase)